MVLKRIVHLAVPSENVSRRGKKITKSCLPTMDRADRTDGTWRSNARANLKKTKGGPPDGESRVADHSTLSVGGTESGEVA
jgi:hypothetical protein